MSRSERHLPAELIDRFAAELARLNLSSDVADEVFQEARRRYLALAGEPLPSPDSRNDPPPAGGSDSGAMTLEDLSYVLSDDFCLSAEIAKRVRRDVLSDPRYMELLKHAEQLRRDAGVEQLSSGIWHGLDFEQLLEADDWDDPAEVLMPAETDTSALGHQALIRIAEARIARGEPPEKLLALKERVERAAGKQQLP